MEVSLSGMRAASKLTAPPGKTIQVFIVAMRLFFFYSLLQSGARNTAILAISYLAIHLLLMIRTWLTGKSSTQLASLTDLATSLALVFQAPNSLQVHAAMPLAVAAPLGSICSYLLIATPFASILLQGEFHLVTLLLPQALLILGLGHWIRIQQDQITVSKGIDQVNGLYNLQGLTMALRLFYPYMRRNQSHASLIVVRLTLSESFPTRIIRSLDGHIDRVFARLANQRLRHCDIVSRYKHRHYAILLMDSGPSGASLVARDLSAALEQWRALHRIKCFVSFAIIPLDSTPVSILTLLAHGEDGLNRLTPDTPGTNITHVETPS